MDHDIGEFNTSFGSAHGRQHIALRAVIVVQYLVPSASARSLPSVGSR